MNGVQWYVASVISMVSERYLNGVCEWYPYSIFSRYFRLVYHWTFFCKGGAELWVGPGPMQDPSQATSPWCKDKSDSDPPSPAERALPETLDDPQSSHGLHYKTHWLMKLFGKRVFWIAHYCHLIFYFFYWLQLILIHILFSYFYHSASEGHGYVAIAKQILYEAN